MIAVIDGGIALFVYSDYIAKMRRHLRFAPTQRHVFGAHGSVEVVAGQRSRRATENQTKLSQKNRSQTKQCASVRLSVWKAWISRTTMQVLFRKSSMASMGRSGKF